MSNIEKIKLPTIEDLRAEPETIEKNNQLNVLLNNNPKQEWLKEHPIIKVQKTVNGQKVELPYIYLPIERIEWLLTRIYTKWNVEIISYNMIANSVCVHVRLHYLNPITNEMEFQDGIGAAPLQTNKDAGAIDWNNIKSSAVQIALPAAESFAVKDAAEKLGKLFGKDLNRADQISYAGLSPEMNIKKLEIAFGKAIQSLHEDLRSQYIEKANLAEANGEEMSIVYQNLINEINA